MITKETCVQIWNAHNEIEKSQKLLEDMAEMIQKDKDRKPDLRNAFGDRSGLQLGIPSGDNGHRIFNVSYDLSVPIIEEHINEMRKRLKELKAIAKIELYGKEDDNG